MERTRVLLAEDDDLLAEMVTALLTADERIELVGRAGDGAAAVEQAIALSPDVVLMDIHMPRLDGIQAVQELRRRGSQAEVVILTGSDMPGDKARAIRSGAVGYVSKERARHDLVPATLAAAREERRDGERAGD